LRYSDFDDPEFGPSTYPVTGGVVVEGYEEIAVRWLFFLSPLIEHLFLQRRFEAIWDIGWRRLRKRVAARQKAA
jgi:hypothetical protein